MPGSLRVSHHTASRRPLGATDSMGRYLPRGSAALSGVAASEPATAVVVVVPGIVVVAEMPCWRTAAEAKMSPTAETASWKVLPPSLETATAGACGAPLGAALFWNARRYST